MFGNPLWWVHLQMAGRLRGLAILGGAFLAVIFLFHSLSYKLADARDAGKLSAVWLGIMTVAEGLFLLVLAPGAIRRAVQRDFQSGMIESHRLTPMSNWRIVLGYLIGPTAQAAVLFAAGLLVGTYFAAESAAGLQLGAALTARVWIGGWILVIATFLAVAIMFSSFVLLTGIATSGKTNVIGVVIAIGVFGGWMVVFAVPGLGLLLGVFGGGALLDAIFFRSGAVSVDPRTAMLTAPLQLVFAGIFLNAACGKLRRPERAIFGIWQAVVLLVVWGLTLVVGLAQLDTYAPLFGEFGSGASIQIICSIAAFMLVAFFASRAAAVDLLLADRAAAHGERPPAGHTRSRIGVPILLAGLTWLALAAMIRWTPAEVMDSAVLGWTANRVALLSVCAAFFLSFAIDFGWLYITAVWGMRPMICVLLLAVGLKAIPIVADLALFAAFTESSHSPWTGWGYLTALSPIGTLMLLNADLDNRLWIGLAVQAAVLFATIAVFQLARRRTLSPPALPPLARPLAGS
ncbi:MAG: hypothetical protein HZB38_18905 [Planctomycetes bacterium]|nr:hypothetical protein [Planctomycetota bacterium]